MVKTLDSPANLASCPAVIDMSHLWHREWHPAILFHVHWCKVPFQRPNEDCWCRTIRDKMPFQPISVLLHQQLPPSALLRPSLDSLYNVNIAYQRPIYLYLWNPQGQRNRGRPKNTWRRGVEQEMKEASITWVH